MADDDHDGEHGGPDPEDPAGAPPSGDLDEVLRRAGDLLADAAAISVGLGVLAVNRLQALRRSLATPPSAGSDGGPDPRDAAP